MYWFYQLSLLSVELTTVCVQVLPATATDILTYLIYSRDWSEIVRMTSGNFVLPCNRLYLKKPAGMHWLGYNDAVSWLNEAKTRTF